MPEPEVSIPAAVFVAWATWLDAGEPEKVRADLADLLARYRAAGHIPPGPDPPSSAGPVISTR